MSQKQIKEIMNRMADMYAEGGARRAPVRRSYKKKPVGAKRKPRVTRRVVRKPRMQARKKPMRSAKKAPIRRRRGMRGGCEMCGHCPSGGFLADDGYSDNFDGGYLADDGYDENFEGGSTRNMRCAKYKKVPSVYGHPVKRCVDFVKKPRKQRKMRGGAQIKSPWLKFVKQFTLENPQLAHNRPMLLKEASKAYRSAY